MTKKSDAPAIRFKGFSDAWEQRKVLSCIQKITDFRGRTPKKLGMDWSESGYLALSALNVKDGYIDFSQDVHYGDQALYDKWMSGNELHKGQVLFTTEAPMGNVAQVPDNRQYILSQRTIAFDVREDIITENFLATLLRSPAVFNTLTSLSSGGTAKGVSQKSLAGVEVRIPVDLREQALLATYFHNLDNLITLHQRKFEKLTNVKKSMLEKMFPQNGCSYPEIRFKGFTDAWEQRKFSEITFLSGEKNRENLPLESYSITNESGFVPQDEKFENGGTMREADKRMYYIVSPNSFAYNPARINVGSIGYQNTGKNVIVSSLYEIFKTSDDVDDRLLWHWFKSPDFQKLIWQLQEGGVRLYFYYDKLCMGEVSLPSLVEQRKIGKFFDTLDNLITLHQRQPFLHSPPDISLIVQLTPPFYTFSWEQRKFDEVFDCTVPNNTLSRAELSYDEGTVLNVHYGDVLIKYGSVLDVQKDDIPRIPHRCREDFNGALLQDGDVIIADTAEDETTGKACEIGNLQGSAIVSGLHTMVCRPRNRMALGYLGYYLNSNAYHHQLLPLMQGIKVLSLSRSNIQKTSVSYPIAVKEQQLIAYYFSQLDNLITLHQRQTIVYAVIRSIRKVILAERQYFAPPMVRKSP